MNIKEAAELKTKLENVIADLLLVYQEQTGLTIKDFYLEKISLAPMNSEKPKQLLSVRIEANL